MIRPFQLRDARLVARLQQVGIPLDVEEQLTHPRSPLRSVLIDSVLFPRSGPSTFILDQKDENSSLSGLAQMRIRPGRLERDVVFMSPSLEQGNGSHAIWQRLLTHLCVQTAERGSLRLYTRLPVDSEELHVFRNVGFLEYGQEDVYRLSPAVDRTRIKSTLRLRPQQSSDGWGLQKLYAAVTPRSVQNSEGLAQGQWALPGWRWGQQGRRYGYVWEWGGELLCALHIRAGKRGYWVRTLLHPDALDQAKALGEAALGLTAGRPDLPVYFALRHYEIGWRSVLIDLGFQPFTGQTLLVKPMTVRVREKLPVLMSALEKKPTEGAATTAISHSELIQPEPAAAHNGHARRPGRNIFTTFS